MIRVLIAEDQGMVRGALASLLSLEPDIEVVGQVARGDKVVAAVSAAEPDIALLDIEMPGATGLEAAEQLRCSHPSVRVLILTTFGRPGYLRRAMEGGASGFLLKDAPANELATAIRRAVTGERVVDPGLAAAALSQGECPLTPREHEVLAASRVHATVADMASALYLSPGTVRNHLSSVMQKLDARNRAEAGQDGRGAGLALMRRRDIRTDELRRRAETPDLPRPSAAATAPSGCIVLSVLQWRLRGLEPPSP